MLIIITVASILGITVLVWFAKRVLPFTVCPICAGIFLTWVGLVGAYFSGYEIDLIIPAFLMGGSVVGIAYQMEKKFRGLSADMLLLWKALFMPAGFAAAYFILAQLWIAFLVAAAFLLLISFAFLSASLPAYPARGQGGSKVSSAESVDVLEKKMKECC